MEILENDVSDDIVKRGELGRGPFHRSNIESSRRACIRKAASDAGFNIFIIADEYYAGTPPDPPHISLWDGIFGYDV